MDDLPRLQKLSQQGDPEATVRLFKEAARKNDASLMWETWRYALRKGDAPLREANRLLWEHRSLVLDSSTVNQSSWKSKSFLSRWWKRHTRRCRLVRLCYAAARLTNDLNFGLRLLTEHPHPIASQRNPLEGVACAWIQEMEPPKAHQTPHLEILAAITISLEGPIFMHDLPGKVADRFPSGFNDVEHRILSSYFYANLRLYFLSAKRDFTFLQVDKGFAKVREPFPFTLPPDPSTWNFQETRFRDLIVIHDFPRNRRIIRFGGATHSLFEESYNGLEES